jgi:hypothetical protein
MDRHRINGHSSLTTTYADLESHGDPSVGPAEAKPVLQQGGDVERLHTARRQLLVPGLLVPVRLVRLQYLAPRHLAEGQRSVFQLVNAGVRPEKDTAQWQQVREALATICSASRVLTSLEDPLCLNDACSPAQRNTQTAQYCKYYHHIVVVSFIIKEIISKCKRWT